MKKTFIFCLLFLFVTSCPLFAEGGLIVNLESQNLSAEEEVLHPFFMALKNGEVDEIKQYLSDDMYEKRRVLLEQNKEYPAFLREYYAGAQFSVVEAVREGDDILVGIMINFAGGHGTKTRLRLRNETANPKLSISVPTSSGRR